MILLQNIEDSINEVYQTLGTTPLMVVIVIYTFLGDFRATLIPALTVPVSLQSAFTLIYALGFSINLLTLLAMVLAIGLLLMMPLLYLKIFIAELKQEHRHYSRHGKLVSRLSQLLVLIAVFVRWYFLRVT